MLINSQDQINNKLEKKIDKFEKKIDKFDTKITVCKN